MFQIEISSHAKKFLKRCDGNLYSRLMEKIKLLSLNPFPQDMKRIVGRKEKIFRIRVGDYRVLYAVFHETKMIVIADIDKRSRIYE